MEDNKNANNNNNKKQEENEQSWENKQGKDAKNKRS